MYSYVRVLMQRLKSMIMMISVALEEKTKRKYSLRIIKSTRTHDSHSHSTASEAEVEWMLTHRSDYSFDWMSCDVCVFSSFPPLHSSLCISLSFSLCSATHADRLFDESVGALEEMLLDDEFLTFQQTYFSRHCHEFDSSDENKLVYTSLFDSYVSQMESLIDRFLTRHVGPSFSMVEFMSECESRGEEQLGGDAFDMLMSLSEFDTFKEMMIAEKEKAKWTTTNNSGPKSPSKQTNTDKTAAAANK